jgi:plasmid maintenance system antidote protein VapI
MTATRAEYRAARARAIAYGTWQPFTADPALVREHVRQLRARGGSYQAIAAAAGVSTMAVHALLNGQGRVRAETADALMKVRADGLDLARTPTAGTTLRVRALVAMGHSCERQAQALGCHREVVQKLARGELSTVPAGLQADAARLYDAWWDKRPPERTRGERRAAEACRGRAERSGWCTGAALDEDRVEEPGYAPRAGWRRAEGTGLAPEDPLGRHASAGPGGEVLLVPGRAGRREPERELEAAG